MELVFQATQCRRRMRIYGHRDEQDNAASDGEPLKLAPQIAIECICNQPLPLHGKLDCSISYFYYRALDIRHCRTQGKPFCGLS